MPEEDRYICSDENCHNVKLDMDEIDDCIGCGDRICFDCTVSNEKTICEKCYRLITQTERIIPDIRQVFIIEKTKRLTDIEHDAREHFLQGVDMEVMIELLDKEIQIEYYALKEELRRLTYE
jgi:hypothetical protein